jgi:peptide/nickel transport system permease protein
MGRYLANRLLQFVPTLLLVSLVVFAMVRAIPGNPAIVLLGPTAEPAQIAAMERQMGLDRPIWEQYGRWAAGVLQGDLGASALNGFPVASLVASKLGATAALTLGALVVGVLLAIPVGLAGALRPGGLADRVLSVYAGLALGVPTFWLGLLLVLVFSLRLRWLPPSGYVPFSEDPAASLRMLLLPSLALGVYLSAIFGRFLRASILDVARQDHVRTATAKGLRPRAVAAGHVLRNALIPVVTVVGLQFGGLLGGAVVVESIFAWPGVGRLLVTSISSRDYAVVQAVILLSAVAYLLVNLLTDLAYGLLDPRIRAAS